MKKIIKIVAILLVVVGLWFYIKRRQPPIVMAQEKVLTTAIISPIQSLDPIQAQDHYSISVLSKTYEGLLSYHYLERPLELIPNLAEDMPLISEDQLVYVFKIKKGVNFHDNPCFPQGKGRELTAYDFVYSFKRIADPKLQSANFSLFVGKIKGLDDWRKKYVDIPNTDYTEEIVGLKALDLYTLQFTLTKPCPQFLYLLTMAPCYVVAHEAVKHYGMEFGNYAVGTGPFILETFKPQDTKIIYCKNPNFRDKYFPSQGAEKYKFMQAYAGKKLPLVDKVIAYILPEEQTRWLKFKKGELDIIDISTDNAGLELITNKKLAPELIEKGVHLFQELDLATSFIVFNNLNPIFRDNLKLRQAMSMAFDAKQYDELFSHGVALLAQSIIPPGLAGYRDDYQNPYRVYNIEKAKAYLAEAGYPDGKGLPEITLDVAASTDARQKGEFFQQCMKKIGIHIKVVQNIFPELVKKINTKATMLHSISWKATYPDAENFLQLLYGSNELGIGCCFNDPEFNSLYEKAVAMPDSPARTKLYEQLNKIAAEKVPMIYLIHRPHTALYQGWVKNYANAICTSGTEEQYIDIELAEKSTLFPKLQ